MELTKASQKEIMNRHTGSGHVFISDGSGKGIVCADIGFVKNDKGYHMSIAKYKPITLTEEQANAIGGFFIDETE